MTSIATRLDGLPLAIELAAVQVRAMTVEEIDRRLENRFALLRGGDRSAPDRHQTLLAVIDWSWNLLDADERRALRRLALFNDGFTLEAAEAVLGADAVPAVQGLVGQSLLAVRESALGVRYRMLETVREFGRMQLTDAGEDGAGRAALRRWAVGYARAQGARLTSAEQFAAMDALAEEETNLADELRGAIADGDPARSVELMAALGMFWMIRGEHVRVLVLADAVFDAIGDWHPPPELRDAIHSATAIMMANSMVGGGERLTRMRATLRRLGAGSRRSAACPGWPPRCWPSTPRTPGLRAPAGAARGRGRPGNRGRPPASGSATCGRTPATSPARWRPPSARWSCSADDGGPWASAMPRAMLAQLTLHRGDRAAAAGHARAALPVMQRLGASDDEIQLRALLVFCAIADGRLAEAEAELAPMDVAGESGAGSAGWLSGRSAGPSCCWPGATTRPAWPLTVDCMASCARLSFPASRDRAGAVGDVRDVAGTGRPRALRDRGRRDARARAVPAVPRGRAAVLGTADALDYPVVGMLLLALGRGPAAPGWPGAGRGPPARARGPVRLQQRDPDAAVGADRGGR